MKLETERLIIDTIRETDKEDYFHNISHDRKVLETFVCSYAESLEEFDFSPYLRTDRVNNAIYAIRLKETDRLIGIVTYFDEAEGSCEIGYGIGSSYWHHGYATEAVQAFIDWLFREKGLKKIYASFFTGNEASMHVMEKCGMVYSHINLNEMTYLGIARDLTYYVIANESE